MDIAEQARKEADEDRLAEEGEDDDGGDAAGVVKDKCRIEQHADADEKEKPEEITDGHDIAERLVAELRFAEDETGDKSTEVKGEPREPGGIADPDADGDDRDKKKLARAPGEYEAQKFGE